ncbi:transposase [Enemella evansiae]
MNLSKWPEGMRVIVRRERPHPGAQLSLFEERDGWRYQAFVTNTPHRPGVQLAFLEARHRAHARVEDRIRHAKDSGLGRFPSREFAINQAWLTLVQIAADLTAWTRLLALVGDAKILATCEPKALRYRFLHVPARLTHSPRRRRLQIPKTWPWAAAIVAVLRDHRRDPVARLTTPVHPRHHHPENRRPAAPADPTSRPQTITTPISRNAAAVADLMKDGG